MGETSPEEIKLWKKAYYDKHFSEFYTSFRRHGCFKKWNLSAELVLKPGRTESVLNDRNVNILWTILQENRRITGDEMAVPTSI